jgi:arylsulfatase A-like enzyme
MFNVRYFRVMAMAAALGAAFEASWQLSQNPTVLRPPLWSTVAADALVAWAVTGALFWFYAAVIRALRRRREADPGTAGYAAVAAPLVWYATYRLLPHAKLSWVPALAIGILVAPLVGAALGAVLRRRNAAIVAAGTAAVVLLAYTAFSLLERTRPAEPDRTNVILITLDTTRADRLGCYGYAAARTPNLDGLAGHGAKFDGAVCLEPLTAPSHATIMTSLYPETTGVILNGMKLRGDVPTLSEQFRNAGYATAAFVASSSVCARDTALDRGFEIYDDAVTPAEGYRSSPLLPLTVAERLSILAKDDNSAERPANEVTDAAVKWLKRHGKRRPFFLWLHYFDPHDDYLPPAGFAPPELAGRPLPKKINENWAQGKGGPKLPARIAALYDGEIAFMDAEMGRFLETLKGMGLAPRTAVVVVADHGEAFGEHGTKYHGFRLYREEIGIPFIVCDLGGNLPAVPVRPSTVSTLDVAPTILDLAGMPAPPSMRGRALFRDAVPRAAYCLCVPEARRQSKYAVGRLEALVSSQEKLIVHADGTAEYYDLTTDPGETVNLAEAEANRVIELRAALERIKETVEPAPAPAFSTDRETMDKLRTLGYVK